MDRRSIAINALKMDQPMGTFYVGVMSYKDIADISYVDMRQIERDLDNYIGIQRKLNEKRVKEIGKFVNTIDAAFPTSIVLAVPGYCAQFDEATKRLVLAEGGDPETGERTTFNELAKVLDGQHRIEGLKAFEGQQFEVPVTIFVNADIADQAYIFATVNLAQTKVNRSLVYDLLDYSRSRSPQKTCHDVAVALNNLEDSPFYRMIKRLGSATPGVAGETLTQATVVTSLLPFISDDPITDRDRLMRGKKLKKVVGDDWIKLPFRNFFIDGRDEVIAENLINYFSAVAERWTDDWNSRERGNILPRTNGFRAFMSYLKVVYPRLASSEGVGVISKEEYEGLINMVDIKKGEFDSEEYLPGTSGENKLFRKLLADTGIDSN